MAVYDETTYKIIGIGDLVLREIELPKNMQLALPTLQKIDEIWVLAQNEKGGHLFNGDLLNFDSIEKTPEGIIISGYFVEYKHFIAHRKAPDLALAIHPVGVSGVILLHTLSGSYMVFGKRAEHMTQYPGAWELMPSGSIDKAFLKPNHTIDVCAKLEEELIEETGITKAQIQSICAFAFVYDNIDQVYDICCEVNIETEQVDFLLQMQKTSEYSLCEFVALEKVDDFLRTSVQVLVPTSLALIGSYLKWKKDYSGRKSD